MQGLGWERERDEIEGGPLEQAGRSAQGAPASRDQTNIDVSVCRKSIDILRVSDDCVGGDNGGMGSAGGGLDCDSLGVLIVIRWHVWSALVMGRVLCANVRRCLVVPRSPCYIQASQTPTSKRVRPPMYSESGPSVVSMD